MPTQSAEQKKAAFAAANLTPAQASGVNIGAGYATPGAPIDIAAVTSAPTFNTPAYAAPVVPPVTPPPLSEQLSGNVDAAKAAQDKSLADLGTAYDTLGTEAVRRTQLETVAGIPDIEKQLQELYAKDAQYQADLSTIDSQSLQSQLKSEDRLAPTFAINGEQAQAARQATFLRQGININRATNAAIIASAQGRLSLAQDYIQRALDTEFKPLESKIAYLKEVLDINKDSLSKAETAQLNQAITDNQRTYEEAKQNKTDVYSIMLTASKYGADPATIKNILAAPNREQAVVAASKYLQDPQAQYELESARLDNILKQAQITKTQKETAQIGQPTAAERKAQEAAIQQAKDAIPAVTDKINGISALLSHPGLTGSVGAYGISRWTPLSADKSERQDFIAGVQQLISKDTLDTLINLKAQGGTLGALSDQERVMLQQAASKISSWAVHDKNDPTKVIGYEIGEDAFKAELSTIQSLAERARDKALGNAGLVTPDETAAIEQFLSGGSSASTPSTINPALYF